MLIWKMMAICHSENGCDKMMEGQRLMVKKPIRNLRSDKPVPPRLCDVVVDGDDVTLQFKTGKNEFESMPWPDIVSQVEEAKKTA